MTSEIVGEEYAPLGRTDFSTIVNKLKGSGAEAVFNTLNGDSNVAFFKEYKNAGLAPETTPVISVSIAEKRSPASVWRTSKVEFAAWNYFQTIDSPENHTFVEAFKAKYGQDRVTSDPMESAYTSLYLWKEMAEKAIMTSQLRQSRCCRGRRDLRRPRGQVTVDGENHHLFKAALIGQIASDGLLHTVWRLR